MTDPTLGDVADLVRSKNAGPFWLTFDVFLPTDEMFQRVIRSGVVDPGVVGGLYRTPADDIRIFRLPALRAIKITLPRPTVQGSFHDRDMHSGQQELLLANIPVPSAD